MKNQLYILIFVLAGSCGIAHSQEGYLGRTRSISLGVTSNFPLFPFNGGEDYRLIFEDNSKVFFPKIDLGYSIQKRRTVVDFEARYQMLPNIIQYDFSSVAGPNLEEYINDTTKMKSDVYRLGIYIKKFSHVAPIGLYIRFGMGLNVIRSKSITNSFKESYQYSEGTYSITNEKSIRKRLSVIGDVSLSVGKLIPLSRRTTLDFGIQSNFTLAKFKFDGLTDGELYNPVFRKWIVGRSLFSHNIFEAYVKIHFFH